MKDDRAKDLHDDTLTVHAGRDPHANFGIVNPPVYHASTILHRTVESWESRHGAKKRSDGSRAVMYGRIGTPTTYALEDAISALEGAAGTVLAPSGLGAITTAILSLAKAGGHILVPDSAYEPVRKFCEGLLPGFDVETEYYDPAIGDRIERLFRPNTKLLWLESPGSLTFEVQDVPAMAGAARAKGVPTALDNTWSAGYFLKPLALGVDISVQAATKYIVGHSDAMAGTIACNEALYDTVRAAAVRLGTCLSPDDAYLAQRGLRTLGPRLKQHHQNGLRIARWLQGRPEVARVLHPGLEDDPGHALWKRDFTGASGLFGVLLHPVGLQKVAGMLEGYRFFGIGASWGGFESLAITTHPERTRTAVPWTETGPLLRYHIGLEDPDDLIADLEQGFDRLNA